MKVSGPRRGAVRVAVLAGGRRCRGPGERFPGLIPPRLQPGPSMIRTIGASLLLLGTLAARGGEPNAGTGATPGAAGRGLAEGADKKKEPKGKKARGRFTVGKETTYVT